jgi:hypothetical protein
MAAGSRLDSAPLSERLPGTWKLVSRIDVVTADGQLATGCVTQRLLGCLSNENVGQELTRAMAAAGDTLTIQLQTTSSRGEPITRTLTWQRVG